MKTFFLLLVLICGFVPKTFSAELSAKSAAQENRFLFVVDTSLSLSRSAKAVQETVRELIESGMQGQMHSGDTFGLWTFNERLNTEFPMQRWTPGDEKKLAQFAEDFLKKRRYEKKSQLSSVLPIANQVVKSSKSITVILISNGNEPIQGTPFDKQINAIYPSYVRELHDAKLAFVTVLVGRNGELVAYSVNSSLSPIFIPPPIEHEKITTLPKTNAVAKAANRPPVHATNQIAAPKPQPKITAPHAAKTETNIPFTTNTTAIAKVETKPEIKTNEVIAVISTNISTPITAPKIEISIPPVQTNLSDSPVPKKIEPPKIASESSVVTTVHAPTSSSTPQNEPPKKIEAASSPPLATVLNTSPTNAVTVTIIQERANDETANANSSLPDFQLKNSKTNQIASAKVIYDDPSTFEAKSQTGISSTANLPKPKYGVRPNKSTEHNTIPSEPTQPAQQITAAKPAPPAVVATTPLFTPQKLLIAGTALLGVAGVLVWLLVRNSRKSQPSIISRSIDKSK